MRDDAPPSATCDEDNELEDDPVFDYGTKVRARKHIKNDGTFPGAEIGEVIVRKGEVGYVHSIGTFLQRYYIYGIDFIESGKLVGMRLKELEPVEEQA
ncbi:nitrogen fixation protein NifZ [Rhodospirillum rubrum]|uniref:NifZ n=1 Tax=Rhodospirillum rubrum (strain ATCC 11170 / ATH 1.1.1 / DSM 467 / LMG 4362 / NCIMB 8255 / S1) TaxID=269796 RepID=Q2RVP7_RHORT|nr:nitrogen fixation protein NifZ [Rhodospirillum rubrum]ABC21798.1 NifZ [Rhodospirillum rubrum ATCC 11170]AEO47498.1 NifZ [Rhodospirillum rubrum F11]MBK5953355.1 nitrogen fixation protein NifZ [Rhodospirillum rubrum]QXG81462.1 nitrogen fixation protein NifZ [Rhodospirillum rubrum]HAQ01434.1 nitrogen fixation protein NifZ [Rhodospirillum rubrum]